MTLNFYPRSFCKFAVGKSFGRQLTVTMTSGPPKKKQKLSCFESTATTSPNSMEVGPKRRKTVQRSNPEIKENELDLSTVKLSFELHSINGLDPLILEFDEDESIKEIETKIGSITGIGDRIRLNHQFTPNNRVPKSFTITIGDVDIIDFNAKKFQISSNTRFIQYWNDFKDEINKYDQTQSMDSNQTNIDSQYELNNNELQIGAAKITFQRTLKIPDDDKTYPLPPGLGAFNIVRVEDYMTSDGLPQKWKKRKGIIIPMWQKEAMWMDFQESSACLVICFCIQQYIA